MRRFHGACLILIGLVALSPLSCRDDGNSSCPVCPGAPPAEPTLENIWPNADSTAWTYTIAQRQWSDSTSPQVYPSAEEVPPAPTIDEIRGSLWAGQVSERVHTVRGTYRLQFLGRMTTESGAEGQLLKETVYSENRENPKSRFTGLTASFYRHLARARPDLKARLLAKGLIDSENDGRLSRSPDLADTLNQIEPAYFYLHGHAWERTAEQIGGYGDLDTVPSWKFLERDLSPGHEFVQQLVPELADDVFLHARILPRRSVATEAGLFTNCVECAYLIDYGIATAVSENGQELGSYRVYDFASIIYAPGYGPVASYQRTPPLAPAMVAGDLGYALDFRISLIGTNVRSRNP